MLGLSSALALLVCLAASTPSLAAMSRPAKLGQCVACHGEDGVSRSRGAPHLGGQDETYLVAALHAYRNGSRQQAPMNAIANTLQPRDIVVLAKWYSTQKGFKAR